MRRTLQAIMAFAVLAMLLAGTASAATSQGLEWGITVGDQSNFDITATTEGVVETDEVIYMEVLVRPVIPNIITALGELPFDDLDLDISWANGTDLGWSGLIFILLFVATPSFIFPIGNYTLLTELYNADDFYNGTVYDSGGYWGVNFNDFEFSEGSNQSIDIHVDYLKDDGVLAHWTVTMTNTTSSQVTGSIIMTRQGLPGLDIVGWIRDNLLLVGVGVGIVVILGAVVCMRRK